MGKPKKASKAGEKKKERKELEKRMNERLIIVKAANDVEDPLAALPSFQNFVRNGLNLSVETINVACDSDKTWMMDLMRTNMKTSYEASSWGWKEKNKRDELFEEAAWYMIVRDRDNDNAPVAFSHFRYDMDYDDEVLYVYEIQIDEKVRRKGLGKFMMVALEMLAIKADMRKIMLTVFKHNPEAVNFFKACLKFDIDETCMMDDINAQFDYEILSKFNKQKLKREADALAEGENNGAKANAIPAN